MFPRRSRQLQSLDDDGDDYFCSADNDKDMEVTVRDGRIELEVSRFVRYIFQKLYHVFNK